MAVEMEGLEFQIEAKSAEASKGVDALIASFTRLKGALNGKGLVGLSAKLDAVNQAVSESGIGRLEGLSSALHNLKSVKISSTIPKRLGEIGAAIDTISLDGVSEVERLSQALRGMDGVKLPNLSKAFRSPRISSSAREQTGESVQDAPVEFADMKEEIASAASRSDALRASLKGLSSIAGKVGAGINSNFATAFPGFEKLTAAVKPLSSAFGGLTGKVSAFAAAHPALTAALAAATAATKALLTHMKKLGASAFSTAKTGVSYLKSAMKSLNAEMSHLSARAFQKFLSNLKSLGGKIAGHFTRPFTRAFKAFGTWKSAIGRVGFYRAVRAAIKAITDGFKTGIENLYQYSRLVGTEFAPAMNSLASSAQYLKNSLGAMAAPLVQALAPVIDFLIDKFVALLNIIGKVFAALTGKSVYTQAKKQAVEYGEAAGAASKATKDFLLGIDELNVINTDSGSGSGGGSGGGGADFGSMFEEVEIPNEIADWAKKIRDAIDAGDWRGVGEILGNKLNEIVDSWDAYGWGVKLGELINKGLNVAYGFLTTFDFEAFGGKIASFLNGIFDTVDFDLLGRTFAAKWNALFNFIYGFATTLKWHEIGSHIATAINGFLDELDTARAAQAISVFVTGLFELLNTEIRETDWALLGIRLGEFLNNVDWYGAIYGALSLIANGLAALKKTVDAFLSEWDWRGTAREIYTAVNDAFASVDWYGLGRTFSNGFITAFQFLRESIVGIDWYAIGSDVARFLNGIDWIGLLSSLASAIAGGINSAIRAVKGFIDNVNLVEIAQSIGQSINQFFADIDWAQAGQTLSSGIEKALDAMIAFMQTVDWNAVGRHIAEFFENIDWDTLLTKWGQLMGELINAKLEVIDVSGILTVGANIVKGLLDGIVAEISAVGLLRWLANNFINLLINGVKSLLGIHSPSTVFMEIGQNIVAGLFEGLTGAWGAIVSFFVLKLGDIRQTITDAWVFIKENTMQMWEGIKANLGDAWDKLKETAGEKFNGVRDKIASAWKDVKTKTSDIWGTIKTTLGNTWDSLKTTAGSVFEGIRTGIETVWGNVRDTASEIWTNIKSALIDTWETLKGTASRKFNELRTSLETTWNTLRTNTLTVWDSVKKTLTETWEGLKTTAKTAFDTLHTNVESAWNTLKTNTAAYGKASRPPSAPCGKV